MALDKQTKIDKIEIVGDFKIIQVREKQEIIEDGKVISSNFHRTSYTPNQDVSNAPEEVKQAAQTYWTDELKQSYKEHIEKPIEM